MRALPCRRLSSRAGAPKRTTSEHAYRAFRSSVPRVIGAGGGVEGGASQTLALGRWRPWKVLRRRLRPSLHAEVVPFLLRSQIVPNAGRIAGCEGENLVVELWRDTKSVPRGAYVTGGNMW
jgi:hypothetical protein